jgi:hypothetical protein
MGVQWHSLPRLKTKKHGRTCFPDMELFGDKAFRREHSFLKKVDWLHKITPFEDRYA